MNKFKQKKKATDVSVKLLTFQLHNFFWQGTKVVPIISGSLEKVQVQQLSDGKRMYCWKEDSTQEHKLFPTSPFHEEFLFQTPRFLEEFGHFRSKSKKPGEKFPNYLLQFMDKSCQAQGCAHSLHLLCALLQSETLSEQQIHLKFHLLWPPHSSSGSAALQLLQQPKELNGIPVISHLTAPEREDKHRKSCDKTELH